MEYRIRVEQTTNIPNAWNLNPIQKNATIQLLQYQFPTLATCLLSQSTHFNTEIYFLSSSQVLLPHPIVNRSWKKLAENT